MTSDQLDAFYRRFDIPEQEEDEEEDEEELDNEY